MARISIQPATELLPGEKLRLSLDMFEHGCAVMRANLRRTHPDADEDEIDSLLWAWLRDRPGAEHGDGVGTRGTWPRRHRNGDA